MNTSIYTNYRTVIDFQTIILIIINIYEVNSISQSINMNIYRIVFENLLDI